jgi:nucleotide-binding universal stress UspA family protein
VDVGLPTRAILDRAATLPADLIVMGTHGAGGFEHMLLGSVTEKVLRRATCPVLTVPPRARATSTLPFRRVLCAIDFSEWSRSAFGMASSLATESGAELTLVHVIEWPWHEPPAPAYEDLPRQQAIALSDYRRYVEVMANHQLADFGCPDGVAACAVNRTVCHGKPYVELLRLAAETGADLIVLGVHGRNILDLTLFGSTTNQLVRRATCPVLTLRR